MTQQDFKLFMHEQVEYFKHLHGDCKDMTADEIAEDSLEFRRRWSTGETEQIKQVNKGNNNE